MRVHELITRLQALNPNAIVTYLNLGNDWLGGTGLDHEEVTDVTQQTPSKSELKDYQERHRNDPLGLPDHIVSLS